MNPGSTLAHDQMLCHDECCALKTPRFGLLVSVVEAIAFWNRKFGHIVANKQTIISENYVVNFAKGLAFDYTCEN